MLAKYIPGGVWTPAARVVALRRFGVARDAGRARVDPARGRAVGGRRNRRLPRRPRDRRRHRRAAGFRSSPSACSSRSCSIRASSRARAARLLRPFGAHAVMPLPCADDVLAARVLRAARGRSAGRRSSSSCARSAAIPPLSSIPFLGGASAVGAIVAVLAVFAPSGLGVREASVYGLLLAVVGEGVALGATILNRLAITLVEAALLARRRAADPLAPCRTAARARRRARLGKAVVDGARSSSPPFWHSDGTRYCARRLRVRCVVGELLPHHALGRPLGEPEPLPRARRRSGTRSSSSRPRSTRRAGAMPRARARRSPARSG